MKKAIFIVSLIATILSFAACKSEKIQLQNITKTQENRFTCTYEEIKHDFIIDLPENWNKDDNNSLPLVLLLPGYANTAEAFRQTIAFEKEANARGYAAVYVTGAKNQKSNRGGIAWNSGIEEEGNNDVDFLIALTKYLQKEYNFDKEKTFVAGFSNGAFMNHRLAMEASDIFKACVSVAGKMPAKIWEEKNKKNTVGFFQITGEKDDVVPKQSDGSYKFSKDPAIEEVIDYWASSNKLNNFSTEEIGQGSTLTKWKADKKNINTEVWHLFVKGGHHGWPNERFNQINVNKLVIDFFEANSK